MVAIPQLGLTASAVHVGEDHWTSPCTIENVRMYVLTLRRTNTLLHTISTSTVQALPPQYKHYIHSTSTTSAVQALPPQYKHYLCSTSTTSTVQALPPQYKHYLCSTSTTSAVQALPLQYKHYLCSTSTILCVAILRTHVLYTKPHMYIRSNKPAPNSEFENTSTAP